MVVQLETSFADLSHGDFIIKIDSIAKRLAAHEELAPWPDFLPGPGDINEHLDRLRLALGAAASGDQPKNSEFTAMRAEIEKYLTFSAQYAVMIAYKKQNLKMLDGTGLSVRTRSYSRGQNNITHALTNLTVKHGKSTGRVVASATKDEIKGPFELQVSEGFPEREDSWRLLGVYKSCCRMEAGGLQEATKCYFRARAHGDNGPGPWSEVVSLVII